uniref:Uncharacterized protein n=1 Tax=Aegilops tauschii TaxID=37682 RepID=M8BQX8_AEGTA
MAATFGDIQRVSNDWERVDPKPMNTRVILILVYVEVHGLLVDEILHGDQVLLDMAHHRVGVYVGEHFVLLVIVHVTVKEVMDLVGVDALQDAKHVVRVTTKIDLRGDLFIEANSGINLKSLQSQNSFNVIPPTSRATNYVVLRYYDVKGDPEGFKTGVIDESHCHYMVVFQYGSIVLFNVSDHEADGYLKIVERHASGLLPEMRKDDYAVVERPAMEKWMEGGLDFIILKDLSIDGIRTIGSVLGQSIALDYYIRQVDGMVAEFTDINRGMEKTGTFTMERKKLFQLVGKANSNLADVILKLGLFERSDIAWKNANYAQIWEFLRDEYELTQRFGNLDFKLKFVEHNIRFLQEILQNRKSDFLEWLIIILISVEILISVYNIVQEQM